MSEKLKIVFLTGANSIAPSGGFRILAGYADRLCRRGHEVTILAPAAVHKRSRKVSFWIRNFLRRLDAPRRPERPPFITEPGVKVTILKDRKTLTPEDFADADVVIGTWWETLEWMEAAPAHAARVHLVQDHEVFPYLPVERVRAVYKLPTPKIAVSRWLQDEMRDCYGAKETRLVENAIDWAAFDQGPREKPAQPTVGFVYSLALRKKTTRAIEACQLLRERIPELRVVSFGSHSPRAAAKLPPWVDYAMAPSEQEIAEIYGSCSVWLFTSDEEGFGLPILEAMAAGAPVVATPAGAAPQIIEACNGVLVARDAAAVANAAMNILSSSDTDWKAMSRAAVETAKRRSWNKATDEFEAALLEIVAEKTASVY